MRRAYLIGNIYRLDEPVGPALFIEAVNHFVKKHNMNPDLIRVHPDNMPANKSIRLEFTGLSGCKRLISFYPDQTVSKKTFVVAVSEREGIRNYGQ